MPSIDDRTDKEGNNPTSCSGAIRQINQKNTSGKHYMPPKSGPIPIITMILRWGSDSDSPKALVIRILIDTGSTVPLLSSSWLKGKSISLVRRVKPKKIWDFAGCLVPGAGQYYTAPLELQHKDHHVREVFEVAPLSNDFDAILPFWWTIMHPPENIFSTEWKDLSFTSQQCRQLCTKEECWAFALEWDETILTDEEAGILGMVCAAPTEGELQDAIARVPKEFQEFIPLMTTEAATTLPAHSPFDHAIDLKEGTTPPWGPIYALNEMELKELKTTMH